MATSEFKQDCMEISVGKDQSINTLTYRILPLRSYNGSVLFNNVKDNLELSFLDAHKGILSHSHNEKDRNTLVELLLAMLPEWLHVPW